MGQFQLAARGGAFNDVATTARSAYQYSHPRNGIFNYLGVRPSRSLGTDDVRRVLEDSRNNKGTVFMTRLTLPLGMVLLPLALGLPFASAQSGRPSSEPGEYRRRGSGLQNPFSSPSNQSQVWQWVYPSGRAQPHPHHRALLPLEQQPTRAGVQHLLPMDRRVGIESDQRPVVQLVEQPASRRGDGRNPVVVFRRQLVAVAPGAVDSGSDFADDLRSLSWKAIDHRDRKCSSTTQWEIDAHNIAPATFSNGNTTSCGSNSGAINATVPVVRIDYQPAPPQANVLTQDFECTALGPLPGHAARPSPRTCQGAIGNGGGPGLPATDVSNSAVCGWPTSGTATSS